MPTVQMTRNGQITLPIEVRRKLHLDRGSFLELKLKGDNIVLSPQILVNENEIRERALAAVQSIQKKNKKFSAKEIENDVLKAVKAVRSKKGNNNL